VPATRRDMRVALECQWRMERDERNREESLPSNAYRNLEPGEVYRPVVERRQRSRADVAIGGLGCGVLRDLTVAAAYSG